MPPVKKILDTLIVCAYKPPLADGANAPMALMTTEEEKETQTQSKDCSRSASQQSKDAPWNVSANQYYSKDVPWNVSRY